MLMITFVTTDQRTGCDAGEPEGQQTAGWRATFWWMSIRTFSRQEHNDRHLTCNYFWQLHVITFLRNFHFKEEDILWTECMFVTGVLPAESMVDGRLWLVLLFSESFYPWAKINLVTYQCSLFKHVLLCSQEQGSSTYFPSEKNLNLQIIKLKHHLLCTFISD